MSVCELCVWHVLVCVVYMLVCVYVNCVSCVRVCESVCMCMSVSVYLYAMVLYLCLGAMTSFLRGQVGLNGLRLVPPVSLARRR